MNTLNRVAGMRARTVFRAWHRCFAWLLIASLAPLAAAQTATDGRITGRIFNPATQQYVRNAEIRVQGTDLVT